jgi:hypothetical protein
LCETSSTFFLAFTAELCGAIVTIVWEQEEWIFFIVPQTLRSKKNSTTLQKRLIKNYRRRAAWAACDIDKNQEVRKKFQIDDSNELDGLSVQSVIVGFVCFVGSLYCFAGSKVARCFYYILL